MKTKNVFNLSGHKDCENCKNKVHLSYFQFDMYEWNEFKPEIPKDSSTGDVFKLKRHCPICGFTNELNLLLKKKDKKITYYFDIALQEEEEKDEKIK